ncbi:hypothetical protein Ddye_026870 [Dipteronia dyeriana]|uniref:RNase H type-1 domain-containing protein n=1 Tax=Dipteronia dyeriana TaxID=168575 RepID=A0AAD9WQY0_9ROSI|nr:hypothetical protein Ddye_026870 [Dipteronia dyeriana]
MEKSWRWKRSLLGVKKKIWIGSKLPGRDKGVLGLSSGVSVTVLLNLLSWNIRGLGREMKKRVIRNLEYRFKPKIFFIQESKLKVFDSLVVRKLGGTWLIRGVGADSEGASGGLITLWKEDSFLVKACIYSRSCIILAGDLVSLNKEVVLCNIYAPSVAKERRELWDFILQAQMSFLIPRVIGGDFNTVLVHSERIRRQLIMVGLISPGSKEGARPTAKSFWSSIIWNIENRLSPWKKKLSLSGRLVLIKSVTASIPTYFLSIFKIPVDVALAGEKLQMGFLWGDGGSKRKIHAVKWEEVCKSKSANGLGIGRVQVKNSGLLVKWIWRFGRERDALWHSMFQEESQTNKIIAEGFSTVMGKGYRAEFWSELKWDSRSLSEAFPRVFALASKKSGPIQDFGRWLSTRRSLERNSEVSLSIHKVIWNGIFPSNVEVFLWQLYRGRVLVREVLSRFGMAHLSVVKGCMDWWDVSCCCNKSIREWLDGWLSLCPSTKCERAWFSLLSAVVWTIWEVRNQIIFEDKRTSLEVAQETVRFRIAWWFKFLDKGVVDSVTVLMLNLKDACVESRRVKKSVIKDCVPHLMNTFKFNVDGSVSGSSGKVGMSDVLRDWNGRVVCLFSFFMGSMDSNAAEVMAIHKAIEICSSSSYLGGQVVSIMSDSQVVVSWIHNEDFGSLDQLSQISFIRSQLKSQEGIQVIYMSRMFNSFADSLAKMGSKACGNFLHWM